MTRVVQVISALILFVFLAGCINKELGDKTFMDTEQTGSSLSGNTGSGTIINNQFDTNNYFVIETGTIVIKKHDRCNDLIPQVRDSPKCAIDHAYFRNSDYGSPAFGNLEYLLGCYSGAIDKIVYLYSQDGWKEGNLDIGKDMNGKEVKIIRSKKTIREEVPMDAPDSVPGLCIKDLEVFKILEK